MAIRTQIPEVQGVEDKKARDILVSMRSILNDITGRSTKQITKLGPDATLAGIINKVNEIIVALQER